MSDWKRHYDENGYHFPVRVMSVEQAAEYRRRLEAAEARAAENVEARKLMHLQPGAVLDFVDEISRLPSIVEPVTRILGDDVLRWNATLFVKEPKSPTYISWHQDLTYWGMDDSHEVTAWVALSNVTTATGCMKFVPGSHKRDIVEHVDTFAEDNLLSRGQELTVEVDEDEAVHVELAPGEMSLHHGKLFHGSSPNTTDDRRIGLALRYIAPSMSQSSGVKPYARLVAGEDRFGHYRLMGSPAGVLDEGDLALAAENVRVQEQFLFAGDRFRS